LVLVYFLAVIMSLNYNKVVEYEKEAVSPKIMIVFT
jgi:hypothetical protein